MRSSKSRSRSKSNRNRPSGNILNRVFDSSGPEGKVRGTPQQIIEKYNQLARDAQLSNDRVATENFQQHAEHYLRLAAVAQREQAERQAQQQQQQQQQQNRPSNQGGGNDQNGGHQGRGQNNRGGQGDQTQEDQGATAAAGTGDQPDVSKPRKAADRGNADVIDLTTSNEDTGLVETPESKPKPKRTRRKAEPKAEQAPTESEGDAPPKDAAE